MSIYYSFLAGKPDRLCDALQVSCVRQLVTHQLEHVLDSWFCDQLPLDQFPCSLLTDPDTTELGVINTDNSYAMLLQLGPHLLYKMLLYRPAELDTLAALCATTKRQLLTDGLPRLLARLTPAIVQVTGAVS